MKKTTVLTVLAAVLLCGCFKVKDELVILADGSGTVRLEVLHQGDNEMTRQMSMSGQEVSLYPPTSKMEVPRFFPPSAFTTKVTEEETGTNGTRLVIEAAFKDVNALLESPYARAHSLSLQVENGRLVLKGLLGIEPAARMLAAARKDDESTTAMLAEMAESMSGMNTNMSAEFKVTLPAAIVSTNGRAQGNAVTWSAGSAEAGGMDAFVKQSAARLEASCAADGLKFTPKTPLRPMLLSFSQVPEGPVGSAALVDSNKVASAARFVPCALQIQRTIDLSGQGGSSDNGATLHGVVVLPSALKPARWGDPALDEVLDLRGKKLNKDDEGGFSTRHFGSFGRRFSDGDGSEEQDKPATPAEERHPVSFSFSPPDWKDKQIASLKGSVEAVYAGAIQVVKITNAIPTNSIVDPLKNRKRTMELSSREDRELESPALESLNMKLTLGMAMVQAGNIMISLSSESESATVTDACVFDAAGKPWPTLFIKNGDDLGGSIQIQVSGEPPGPLSMALFVDAGGTKVKIPVRMENIPVGN
jgi:hypothetical protein